MLFAAGVRLRYILLPVILVAVMGGLTYYWIHVWDKPVPFLKPFQVNRIKMFFDPSLDKQGASWQINQSMITIGSGGMYGKVPLDWATGKSMLGALSGKAEVDSWMENTQTAWVIFRKIRVITI